MVMFTANKVSQMAVGCLLLQGPIMLLLYTQSDTYLSLVGVHMQRATMIYTFLICKL